MNIKDYNIIKWNMNKIKIIIKLQIIKNENKHTNKMELKKHITYIKSWYNNIIVNETKMHIKIAVKNRTTIHIK